MKLLQHLNSIINTRLTDMSEIHRAIIEALVSLIAVGEEDNAKSQLEMMITTANGEWLDAWGSFFNVLRRTGESDEIIRQMILNSIYSPKTTIPSMKKWILDWLNGFYKPEVEYGNEDVIIKEGYADTLVYSHTNNRWSENYRYTGGRYGRCIIGIVLPNNLTTELKELIYDIKAAGIQVYFIRQPLGEHDVIDDYAKSVLYRHYYVHIWLSVGYWNGRELIYSDYFKGKYSDDRYYNGGQDTWISFYKRGMEQIRPYQFTTWQSPLHSVKKLADFFQPEGAQIGKIEDYVVKVNASVEITPHDPGTYTPSLPPFVGDVDGGNWKDPQTDWSINGGGWSESQDNWHVDGDKWTGSEEPPEDVDCTLILSEKGVWSDVDKYAGVDETSP